MKNEKTLVIIKPDGIQRGLVGEIIKRYERSGLKLIGLKIMIPTKDLIERHYLLDPNWKKNVGEKAISSYKKQGKIPPSYDPIEVGNKVINGLKKYLTAGPLIVMAWSGAHAVLIIRKITGGTEPLSSDVGTIRGDYTIDSYELSDTSNRAIRNLIHASGTPDEANNEIKLWFNKEELIDYRLINEEIIYDVNLDGILE